MTTFATFSPVPATCDVWVLRHGERIDETPDGRAWYYKTDKARRFDPPLTEAGRSQARQAAATLQRLVDASSSAHEKPGSGGPGGKGSKRPLFDAIYCSPMSRCLATAQEVFDFLPADRSPPEGISVVPGIAECAAAARDRGGVRKLSFLSPAEMRKLAPAIPRCAAVARFRRAQRTTSGF